MNHIVLFGATGLTGSKVLDELLAAGYTVTAVSRTASGIEQEHPNLHKVSGDVLSEAFVREIIPGKDAVVSTISEGVEIKHFTQSKGNGNIIRAMEALDTKRFICMGAAGILSGPDGKLVRDEDDYPALYLPLSYEHSRVQEQLRSSALLWTQVCPPMILPRPSDHQYLVQADRLPAGKNEVNAGNIGAYIARELRDQSFLHKLVGIANKNNDI